MTGGSSRVEAVKAAGAAARYRMQTGVVAFQASVACP